MKKTSILVLIPHFNNPEGLYKSLKSISNIEPVDVLIIDDGSSIEPNKEILNTQFPNINKIIYIRNNINRGIEYVLNDGLNYAKEKGYQYIARLDCGDVSDPKRFKVQKEFLDKNKKVYLVGSWVSFIDMKGEEVFLFKPEISHAKIEKRMFISNQFCHPAVMFRTIAIDKIGYYPLNRKAAEDYAYFFKFVKNFKTANIPQILLKYEVNPEGISLKKRKKQILSRLQVILDNFDYSIYAFYGLFRNSVIYFLPYKLVEQLKKWLKK